MCRLDEKAFDSGLVVKVRKLLLFYYYATISKYFSHFFFPVERRVVIQCSEATSLIDSTQKLKSKGEENYIFDND